MRAAPNADALGLVSEFGVHVVRPADMDTRYTQLARTVGLAVRAAFEQGRSVANKYSGSSHVLVLQGYSDAKGPRGFAGGALAALIKDFLVLPCTRIFRKFEKHSKAGAEQEIFSKMAGAAKKNLVLPKKIWGSNPGIELGHLSKLTTRSPGNQLCTCLFEVAR